MRIKVVAKLSDDRILDDVKNDLIGMEFEVVRRKTKRPEPLFYFPGKNPSPKVTVGFVVESMSIVDTLFENNKRQSALWWCGEILPRNDFWVFDSKCCEIVTPE